MNRGRELTQKTAIITIGKVSTQFVSFMLLPLYTSILSTSEYGLVDLAITSVQMLVPITSIMIDQGLFRYLLTCESDEEKKKNISSAFFTLFLMTMLSVALYMIISLFWKGQYKGWILAILVVTGFSNLFLQIARGLNKTGEYALGSFVCSSSIIVLNIVYLVIFNMGASGMLTATFWGNVICCLFIFIRLRIYRYISVRSISKENSVKQIYYALPLVPNQLSIWIMNGSDRVIASYFLGTAANGILAVTHKFPSIYMTFYNMFQLAWHEIGTVHYNDNDRDKFFSDMIDKVLAFFMSASIGVLYILPFIFDVFINSNYSEAYFNIPIYMVASIFQVVVGLLGVVYVATKKTAEITKTTIIAAVVNISINVALINTVGLYAASISTVFGYGLTMIYRIFDTKKYIVLSYNKKRIVSLGVVTILTCIIFYLDSIKISLLYALFLFPIIFYINKDIIFLLWKEVRS